METFAYIIRVTDDHRLLIEGEDGDAMEMPTVEGIPEGDSESMLNWAMVNVAQIHDANGGNMELTIEDHRPGGYGKKTVTTGPGGNITLQDLRDHTGKDLSSISTRYAAASAPPEASDPQDTEEDPEDIEPEASPRIDGEHEEREGRDGEAAPADRAADTEDAAGAAETGRGSADEAEAVSDDEAPGAETAPAQELSEPTSTESTSLVASADEAAAKDDNRGTSTLVTDPLEAEADDAQADEQRWADTDPVDPDPAPAHDAPPQEPPPSGDDSYARQQDHHEQAPYSDLDDFAVLPEAHPAPEDHEHAHEEISDFEELLGGFADPHDEHLHTATRGDDSGEDNATGGRKRHALLRRARAHNAGGDKTEEKTARRGKGSTAAALALPVQRKRPGWQDWAGRDRPRLDEAEKVAQPIDYKARRRRRRTLLGVVGALVLLVLGVGVWVNSNPNVYVATCMDERTMSRHTTVDACEQQSASYYRWWYTPRGSEVPAVGQTVDTAQGSKMDPGERAIIRHDWDAQGGPVGDDMES